MSRISDDYLLSLITSFRTELKRTSRGRGYRPVRIRVWREIELHGRVVPTVRIGRGCQEVPGNGRRVNAHICNQSCLRGDDDDSLACAEAGQWLRSILLINERDTRSRGAGPHLLTRRGFQ